MKRLIPLFFLIACSSDDSVDPGCFYIKYDLYVQVDGSFPEEPTATKYAVVDEVVEDDGLEALEISFTLKTDSGNFSGLATVFRDRQEFNSNRLTFKSFDEDRPSGWSRDDDCGETGIIRWSSILESQNPFSLAGISISIGDQ